MGSAASKTARAAPPRKYPTRAAGASPAQASRPPKASRTQAASSPAAEAASQPTRPLRPREAEAEVEVENKDTDFASRLRQMGIVQPNPTYSPSSTASPAGPSPSNANAEVRGPDADILRQIQQHQQKYTSSSPLSSSPAGRPNTTLSVLEARRRIQDQAAADGENGDTLGSDRGRGRGRREFLTALTLRDTLVLRARGVDAAAIEARLQLKAGVVSRLGPRGLVEALNVGGTQDEMEAKSEKQ